MSPAAAHVKHPTLGVITDPREAYLAGIAEGMKIGWQQACDWLEAAA